MKLYTSDGFTYEGMSEEVVIASRLALGRATTFITKEEYDELMA